jgi:hypothetical protein
MLVNAFNSSHYIQYDEPKIVEKAITLVIDAVRNKAPLPKCAPSFVSFQAACLTVER